VTVVFKNDLLIAVQGDTQIKSGNPATRESAAKSAPGNAPAKSDVIRLRVL
jgi:hypothetical protein